jgi:hypothetical protein
LSRRNVFFQGNLVHQSPVSLLCRSHSKDSSPGYSRWLMSTSIRT